MAASSDDAPTRSLLRRAAVPCLVVVLAAATAFFGYQYYRYGHLEELRTSAVDAASRYTVDLATYDYNQKDANLDTVAAQSTPEFGGKYREVASQLQGILAQGEGVAKGSVPYAGLVSLDADRAVVAVFLDQEVRNVMVPEGRTDVSRMIVTLVRSDDRWLLDAADTK
ncbi:hypothetical protein [Rhodococcus sp. NPDC058521]|uniref:hypothetical protein n=1 Tax=Rhodococcus sp. NPDC058521 TaxID=3346536 RepID=UPI00364DED74